MFQKQTIKELSVKHKCSTKTISRKLHAYQVHRNQPTPRKVAVIIDTTYFGRGVGIMFFMDSYTNEVLLRYHVKYETNILYKQGIELLKRRGFEIEAIICDGRKGLTELYNDVPIQLCQFHQIQAVTRYLTKNPQLEAGKELYSLAKSLTTISKASFIKRLSDWKEKWNDFLQEKTTLQPSQKQVFTHRRLRSAYYSLKRNSNWLFTYESKKELNIPNTTNAIEGLFSHMKRCLRNHNGLSDNNKDKIIDGFLEAWPQKR